MHETKSQLDSSVKKSEFQVKRVGIAANIPKILIDLAFSVVKDNENIQTLEILPQLSTLAEPITITLSTLITEGLLAFDDLRSWSGKYSLLYLLLTILTTAYLTSRLLSWAFLILRQKDGSWLHDKAFAFLHRWAALDRVALSLSGLLLFLNFNWGLPLFLTAALLGAAQAVFLENYVKIRDPSFHSNVATTSGFVLLRTASLLLNALYIKLQAQAILVLVVLLGGLYLVWMLYRGRRVRIHPLPLAGKTVYSAAYISAVAVLLASTLSSRPHSVGQIVLESVVSFAVLLFFCRGVFRLQLSSASKELDADAITDLQYLVATEESLLDANTYNGTQLLLMGLLQEHETRQCHNPPCLVAASSHYKHIDRNSLNLNSEIAGNFLRFKLLLKCLYESRIATEPLSSALVVSYIGFLFNEFDNEYLVCQAYAKFQPLPFSFFERLKVAVILRLLREKRRLFNRQLFGGQLEIESVLDSEKQFEALLAQAQEYVSGQQEAWKYLQSEQIDCKELRKTLTRNFELLEALSAKWEPLKPYFAVNKAWHFLYLFCRAFLSNEELLRKELETMGRCLEETRATHEALLLDAEFGAEALVDRRVLFHSQSLYLHAAHDEAGDTVIVGLSDNVRELSGFNKAELLGSPIEALMTDETRLVHGQKLRSWLTDGSIIIEEAYSIRETALVGKTGCRVRVVKYFKMFVGAQGEIEYVCLLKFNELKRNHVRQQMNLAGESTPLDEQSVDLQSKMLGQQSIYDFNEDQQIFNETGLSPKKFSNNEDNIFLKQDSLQINEEDQQIKAVRYLLRIMSLSIILFFLIANLIFHQSLQNNIQYSKSYFGYMSAYRIPMILGNNYYKSILGVGQEATTRFEINKFTKYMKNVIKDPKVNKIVYDSIYNKDKMYGPYIANEINQNLSYTQIDLFFLMGQTILGLSTQPINRTGRDFNLFTSYIKPAYDNLINSTKYIFHQNFQSNLQSIITRHIYYLIIFTTLIAFLVCIILYRIHCFFHKLEVMNMIVTQIKRPLIKKVQKYYCQLLMQIKRMWLLRNCLTYKQEQLIKQHQIYTKMNIEHEVILNNKVKYYINQKHKCSKQAVVSIVALVAAIIALVGLVSYKIDIIISVQVLKVFQNDGFGFLRYFPCAPIVSLGCFEKLYSLTYSNETTFDPERYTDAVSAMNLFGQVKFGTSHSQVQSEFYQMRANYSFGNPCTYSPDVLQRISVSKEKCETVLNKVITNGLTAYMRAGSALADEYMRGRHQLTIEELDNFSISVTILSAFVLNAIETWGKELIARVEALSTRMTVFAIGLVLGTVLLHLVLIEGVVDWLLRREYDFLLKVYRHMIPEGLLTKEKVVLQELINEGLLASS